MNKKILIVDDDASILDAVSMVLEDAGYIVKINIRGEKTSELVESFKPDLILLDILMSGNDGRKICKTLKTNEKTKNIPIILISAHPSAAGYAKTYGADDFLAKPFEIKDLLDKVKEFTSKKDNHL